MAYIDVAHLSADPLFVVRLGAALQFESAYKNDSGSGDGLSDALLRNVPFWGVSLFMPLISTRPGFAETYNTTGQFGIDDAELGAAIAFVWPTVIALHPDVIVTVLEAS